MMLQIPMSKKAIAEAIGVDKSTVYREIKRNCDARSGSYSMELAQRKADRRKQQKHRKEVLTPAMRKRIIKLLKKGFSPEQIVGRSRLEGIAMVSHETIYRWIWEDKRRGGKLHKYLRRQGRRYAKRGSKNAGRGFIPGRVDIDERPEIVELKERFGDLEIDTIIGKNHKGAILTINDRATSRVWIRKLSGKEAIPVAKIAVWALRKVKNLIHTITADNGKEFAKHEEIAQKLEILNSATVSINRLSDSKLSLWCLGALFDCCISRDKPFHPLTPPSDLRQYAVENRQEIRISQSLY